MIVREKAADFKGLEQEIFSECCIWGLETLKNALEANNTELSQLRDRGVYRRKGKLVSSICLLQAAWNAAFPEKFLRQ